MQPWLPVIPDDDSRSLWIRIAISVPFFHPAAKEGAHGFFRFEFHNGIWLSSKMAHPSS
jgi:hypothetical protein